jgi:prenyltransferase beta subunit
VTLSAIEQHQLWVREKLRPDFTLLEDCLDWSAVDSCLSATFNVVQIGQSALGAYRADDRAVAFVRACFVESEPGFRSRPSQDDRITILNVYSAVSIWRIRSGVPYSESVGFDRAARFLEGGARSGGARIDAIRNRLEMRILEIAETASARRSSLIELHLALATLRQLSDPSRPISARLREATASYLRRCIHRTGGIAAFRLAPDGQECLTACYSARRVAREILSLSEFEDPLERSMEFVRACWNPEAGGFATAPHAEPNLLHSHLGFHLMDPSLEGPNRTPPEFLGYREALSRFIDECRSGAGYAFAPDLPPSAFATRLAIQHRSRNPSARIEPEERARIVAQLGPWRSSRRMPVKRAAPSVRVRSRPIRHSTW